MTLYELVFIVRQDVSNTALQQVTDNLVKIAETGGAEIIKKEYWGLRQLSYEIRNCKKGHYTLLGIKANTPAINELARKIKLSEDIIRHSFLKVDEISTSPSPIMEESKSE